jgi:sigma-B regulation protein RsbQ
MTVLLRNNVQVGGAGERAMIFAHGFGCDQNMWRLVVPAFEGEFQTVVYDHVGAGSSDLSAYDPAKYDSLSGYADDLIEIITTLGLRQTIYVGHSVSGMIGVIAANRAPDLFEKLVLVGPSPRYINDGDYVGGFDEAQIGELLEFLADNHLGWSASMAPAIMGNGDRPELGEELTESFCRTDPTIARQFAEVTFTSDNRADLPGLSTPTLILQCQDDIIAPLAIGDYLHEHIPNSKLVVMEATGHCPNLSHPDEVIAGIRAFV